MMEVLLIGLAVVIVALIAMLALVVRRLWQLMASVECLCTNLGGLREQIGAGHEHG